MKMMRCKIRRIFDDIGNNYPEAYKEMKII